MSRLARPEQPSVRVTRVELLRPLGEGALGYRVRGARVALKKLRRTNPGVIPRPKREIRALARLQQPDLVTLQGLFEERMLELLGPGVAP